MKQLIYYPNKKHKLKNALFIESDCSKNYRVIVPISGTHLELYNEDRLIAEVDGSYITLNGNEILVKKNWVFFKVGLGIAYPCTMYSCT